MAKLRIATAHLTGCFGCHMSLLDLDEKLLDLIQLVEFDKSPLNDLKTFSAPVDLALIEGGCSSDEHVRVLQEFRTHCRTLIAVGACALNGGVPAMRNLVSLEECLQEAFLNGPSVVNGVIPNDPDLPKLLDRVYPAHEVVQIDYFLPGCPPQPEAFWLTLQALLEGREPDLPYSLIRYD